MASILHVTPYFPPDRAGGVGEVVATLHRSLLEAGHASSVVTTGTTASDPLVHRVARSSTGFPLLSARALDEARRADVVHVHHGEALGLLAAMRALGLQTPILLTLHVNVAQMTASLRPYRAGGRDLGSRSLRDALRTWSTMPLRAVMDSAAVRLADSVTFISRSAAVDTLGPDAGARATVIYNAVPPADQRESSSAGASELLFVGTPSPRKRADSLPLVLAEVRKRRPGVTLRIVGFTAAQAPRMLALARNLGVLDAMRFEGVLRGEALTACYRTAGVLLVPSAYEGLPMVILEAFAHGLPCVATRVSGHPEAVVDGVNGQLVPLDDIEAMAVAAVRLLEVDPSTRRALAESAKRMVAERFAVPRQLQDYLAAYASLRR